MATHSRRGINRLMFGSVAEQVLHESSLPVLLIRAG
jgi:nucleotide-binding universal stress UspA family protein